MKLLKQNNWMHLLGLIFVSYIILYWGNTTNGTYWPSSMIKDLASLSIFIQIFLHLFISAVLNMIIGLLELYFLKVALNFEEFIASGIGSLIAFLLWLIIPINFPVFIICCLGLLVFVTYIINSLIISHE